jgi:hypothetical protein
MRWRIGISSKYRETAVGVQMFHMRQRWGAAVWRAQTQVLLGRLKYDLPRWEEAESRRAADTPAEASWRSHASGAGSSGGLDDGGWGDVPIVSPERLLHAVKVKVFTNFLCCTLYIAIVFHCQYQLLHTCCSDTAFGESKQQKNPRLRKI